MRGYLLAAICTPLMLCAPFAGGQVMPPSIPVPELGYKVAPGFFEFPPNWVEGEAAGVALNSKGHIFLFQRTRPMLSEFDEKGHYLRSLGEGLFDHPHGLRIDAGDNIWTIAAHETAERQGRVTSNTNRDDMRNVLKLTNDTADDNDIEITSDGKALIIPQHPIHIPAER